MFAANPYRNYLEAEVLSADPVRLIQMLYRAALESIRDARVHLQNGDIEARSRAITKAVAVIQELTTSLNFDSGAEISRNLARLYEYCQWRLLQANLQQNEAPLGEIEQILTPLYEAWLECEPAPAAAVESEEEVALSVNAAY